MLQVKETNTIELKGATYKVVMLDPSSKDYARHLNTIRSYPEIALDTETFDKQGGDKGLHPWFCAIRLIQIYGGDGTVYVADLGKRDSSDEMPLLKMCGFGVSDRDERIKSFAALFDLLKEIGKTTKCISHNAHYDVLRLAIEFGVWIENPVCTMLGGYVYFGDYGKKEDDKTYEPVLVGGYGLKNMLKVFLNIDIDKTEQKSNWGDELRQEQINYACGDVVGVWLLEAELRAIYRDKKRKLYSPTIESIWDLENSVIPVTCEMEIAGVPVDLVLLREQKAYLEKQRKVLMAEWKTLTIYGYNQTAKVLEHINAELPPHKQLAKLDKAELAECDHPMATLRLQIKALDALLNNLNQFERSTMLCNDGRLHTQFRTISGFGRFTCGGGKFKDLPNMQSISAKENPRIKHLNPPNVRKVIAAPQGYKMLIVDLAGAHGRIAADQANDPVAIAGNNDPTVDNHSKVAVYVARAQNVETTWEEIQGKCKTEAQFKTWRDTAKNTYYGWLNGGGGARIQEQITANTGIKPALESCLGAVEGCKILYPAVLDFRRALMARLKKTAKSVFGTKYAVNEISDGSRLLLKMEPGKYSNGELEPPYTRSLASIWTRIEATAMKRALVIIRKNRLVEWGLEIILTVHDEIDFLVKADFALEAATWVNNVIGDEFAKVLKYVHDGRETKPSKLIVSSWADK